MKTKRTELFSESDLKSILERLLKSEGPVRISASGISMYPFIRKSDVIFLTPCFRVNSGETGGVSWNQGEQEIRIGDIVFSKNDLNQWLIHRVIKKSAGKIITKGDSLSGLDHPVTRGQVWGKVICLERASSGRRYRLEEPGWGRLAFFIAVLSRMEGFILSSLRVAAPGLLAGRFAGLIKKIIRSPKWLLIKILT
jgi:hypothetical protein